MLQQATSLCCNKPEADVATRHVMMREAAQQACRLTPTRQIRDLRHKVHSPPPLRLGASGGVEAGLQYCTSVQVQGAEAQLLLTKLLLNHLTLCT